MKQKVRPKGSKPPSHPQRRKLGKLKDDQAHIHIPVGKHKWKALRELKKARIEAGLYQDVRNDVEKEQKTDLLKVAQKQCAKVKEEYAQKSAESIREEKQQDLVRKKAQRAVYKKKMTAKTKHGQPVMKHQIGYLLHKIKNNK